MEAFRRKQKARVIAAQVAQLSAYEHFKLTGTIHWAVNALSMEGRGPSDRPSLPMLTKGLRQEEQRYSRELVLKDSLHNLIHISR